MLHLLRHILCMCFCSVLLSTANAQDAAKSTQEIYGRIRALEPLINKLEVARYLNEKGEVKALADLGYAPKDPALSSDTYETESQGLLGILEARGSKGQALAAFYTAMFAQEAAKRLAPSDASNKLFEKAVIFWKRAGDAGDPGAYWNLAVMYQRGEGVMKSKLAAIEWDYKAGVGFLNQGQREKALAALEAIQAMDRNSSLGRSEAQLAKGAPN
jgi:TPR repeat protein